MKPNFLLLLGLLFGLGCKKLVIPAVPVELKGQVLDQANRPVAGLEVILYENQSSGGFFAPREATYARQMAKSDDQGRFVMKFTDRTMGCNTHEYASHLSPNFTQRLSRNDSTFSYELDFQKIKNQPLDCRGFNAELFLYVQERHVN